MVALNIKDESTDRLARELAAESGETITEAVRIAIQERLTRVRQRGPTGGAKDSLSEIVRRGRARAVLDDRSAEEILGYGPDGLPA